MVIRGFQWFLGVINGYQGFTMVIEGFPMVQVQYRITCFLRSGPVKICFSLVRCWNAHAYRFLFFSMKFNATA